MNWLRKGLAARWIQIPALIGVCALSYFIRVGELSYFKDDWYYIYDAYIGGPSIFLEMFSIDRPARGPFFEIYYTAFGPNALPYHISAFAWRLVAVIGAFWLFSMLWPEKRRVGFLAAVLFAIYPGYLWWVSAIEYQPMMVSLALQVVSIGLTVRALSEPQGWRKNALITSAILSGWLYILLVDYAIGMEGFRFLCIYMIVNRSNDKKISRETLTRTVQAWMIYAIIPIGFLIWRTFVFNNVRKATDIALQLGVFSADPAATSLRWFIQWIQSMLNVSIAAWFVPFAQNFFGLRLRDAFTAFALAFAVLLIVFVTEKLSPFDGDQPAMDDYPPGHHDAISDIIWLGCLGAIFGVIPVILANRSVTFNLSHYALPVSLAGVVLVIGIIHSLNSARVRSTLVASMIVLAVTTHYAVLVEAISEERAIEDFWWQVSWRVPALQPETTLVINYPSGSIADDGLGVMEAPNLIYFPDSRLTDEGLVHYSISAVAPNDANVKTILVGHLFRETGYRSHTVNFDYKNILILSQPTFDSCVHVIDGRRPVLSVSDPGNVILIASKSRTNFVLPNELPRTPPGFAFGHEPSNSWCHYFERADLAIQQGDWLQAASLGDEAVRLGFSPDDQAEWLPFLQAYAILGDIKKVRNLSTRIGIDDFVRIQACLNLRSDEVVQASMTPEMELVINEKYCRNVNLDRTD